MATDIIQSDQIFIGDVTIGGNLTVSGSRLPVLPRSELAQLAEAIFPIPLTDFKVWDSMAALPTAAAADDLGLVNGTYGTSPVNLRTIDFKNTNTTAYARAMVRLPAEYQAAETVKIRVVCGAVTTIASSSLTIDCEAWEIDSDNTLGASDLCATAAQSCNNLTFASKDFTITSSGLVAGDTLDLRLTLAGTDSATGTAVIGAIVMVSLLADILG